GEDMDYFEEDNLDFVISSTLMIKSFDGFVPVKRNNPTHVALNFIENFTSQCREKTIENNEGRRYNNNVEIHPFKKGVFHIAINSQLPILPVEPKRLEPEQIITTFPPIPAEGLGRDDIEKLIEQTRNAMSEVFHATSREVQQSLIDLSVKLQLIDSDGNV
ncbi:hypothetical protein PV326_012473, partial [Microctonus aethiopoides]